MLETLPTSNAAALAPAHAPPGARSPATVEGAEGVPAGADTQESNPFDTLLADELARLSHLDTVPTDAIANTGATQESGLESAGADWLAQSTWMLQQGAAVEVAQMHAQAPAALEGGSLEGPSVEASAVPSLYTPEGRGVPATTEAEQPTVAFDSTGAGFAHPALAPIRTAAPESTGSDRAVSFKAEAPAAASAQHAAHESGKARATAIDGAGPPRALDARAVVPSIGDAASSATHGAAAAEAVAAASPSFIRGEGERAVKPALALDTPGLAVPLSLSHAVREAAQLYSVAPVRLDTPLGAGAWGGALADKVVWLVGQGHHTAELHLNPPELGPLAVTLSMTGDDASALFVSAHAAVREAVEAALPRLREALAESGISLGRADVSADASPQQRENAARGEPRAQSAQSAQGPQRPQTASVRLARSGLVDTFA